MRVFIQRLVLAGGAVGALIAIGLLGGLFAPYLVGVVVPYLALAIFLGGFGYKVIGWARSPVPFRVPTTCGQEKSLAWVKANERESPSTSRGVLVRMALEVLAFRSLFRNTRAEYKPDRSFAYPQEMWLWMAAIAFHYSLLVIVLRHFRFFANPVPYFARLLADVDGFFEVLLPSLYITDAVLLLALGYLLLRRVIYPQLRYISLANDYFPVLLILSIGLSGALMRHVPLLRVDLEAAKGLAHGIFSLQPPDLATVAKIGPTFFVHLFLVSSLIAYFPFGKLMHMPGVFMSPTRNLANDSRARRHVNPWDPAVKTHSHAEWEAEFHDVIKDAGLPLEKE
jgi:nitrate reductase gamma subunit